MKKSRIEILKAAAMLTQFGLQIFVPVASCIIIGGWLQRYYNLGSWVVILGVVLGVGAGISNLMSVIKKMTKK